MISDKDIQTRKEELRKELEQIEQDMGQHLEDIKTGIQDKLDPVSWIREHPLTSIGIAVGVGLLLGSRSGRRRSPVKSEVSSVAWSPWTELKKVLTSRAISMAVDATEHVIAQRMAEKPSATNDHK